MEFPFDASQVRHKSKHYLAYIGSGPCVACLLTGRQQRGRTTVHHALNTSYGKKCSDFLSVPLEDTLHQNGPESIDALGTRGFLEYHELPPWKELVLAYLEHYLKEEIYKSPISGRTYEIPKKSDYHSAAHYYHQLRIDLTQP